jgi:signal transduction histidine kinase
VNVCEIVEEVLMLLEHQAAPGVLKVVRELPPSVRWEVDPLQFRQTVWNLCLNAVQAMHDGGELRVTVGVVDGRLTVQVSDTGHGISPADVDHVFEPFYSTKPGGSGLGLALVHRIVQDHGGDIDVESSGAGSTFTLRLPVAHA